MRGVGNGRGSGHLPARGSSPGAPPTANGLLQDLLASSIILLEDWLALPADTRDELTTCADRDTLLTQLVGHGLLTDYQAGRVLAGTVFGLTLGNYRILDRIGAGGMGIVFLAEHLCMRRRVAVKMLPLAPDKDPRLLSRFFAEMRAVAQLQHPNIVTAFDAGKVTDLDPAAPTLHFFVMEYVPGLDLEAYVGEHGPLAPTRACDIGHQIASALAEAHKHGLIHRDIKPSNILVTPEGQAKLLDFGLTRHRSHEGQTEPGTLLGTLDYMAPEQVQDASAVDIRADLYGLGGVLFWCLTGQPPFPGKSSVAAMLACRLLQQPRAVRSLRPEIPPELDAVVARMMALKADDRYQTPQAVMQALLPFVGPASADGPPAPAANLLLPRTTPAEPEPGSARCHRLLIADDEPGIRAFSRLALTSDAIQCDEAADGQQALEAVQTGAYDLVLLDVHMPRLTGLQVCRRLRENPPSPNLKIILFSGVGTPEEMIQLFAAGADDCLTKPASAAQLLTRVRAALELKAAQDRCDEFQRRLHAVGQELEQGIRNRDTVEARARGGLAQARKAVVHTLTRLLEHRGGETAAHLRRLPRYSRRLAEEAARLPAFADRIDHGFIETLEACVPLHDIGQVALPDHILLKPGKLDPDERVFMQSHTTGAGDILQEAADLYGFDPGFLRLAADVARHHHERHDGEGYPDRLAGDAIPLAARIVTIGDVYDALRSRRAFRPALTHGAALQLMLAAGGQFDPALLEAFRQCAADFERMYRDDPG
ncbi:MAG: protein kinase [Gemmataceae bacterium]|nr:protein kinase [Gemmataceae bacterium]